MQTASALAKRFEPVPQLLKNVRYTEGSDPLGAESVQKTILAAEAELAGNGRLLIRKSGTEPLIRVMAESEDEDLKVRVVDAVASEEASV